MENNNEKRASRASQTREKESKKKVWTPPSSLDAPPAPDGFHHRWIRAETMGFDDTKNEPTIKPIATNKIKIPNPNIYYI